MTFLKWSMTRWRLAEGKKWVWMIRFERPYKAVCATLPGEM